MITLIVALLAVVAAVRPALACVRFALLPREAKHYYPAALWARIRWRWLTRNLGLSYIDTHQRGAVLHRPGSTSVRIPAGTPERARLRYPHAKIRADRYGIQAIVKTVPRVGRRQLEDQAEHIANAWRCHRAQVHQTKPGRVIVRGLRLDPLTLPLSAAEAPSGVYDGNRADGARIRLYLGLDEWGQHRYLELAGATGITVGGLPGFGKTMFVNSLLMQLAGLPADFVFIDGKGGGDYTDWRARALIYAEDELPTAADALGIVHSEMRDRLATVIARIGNRNAWRVGPTDAMRLLVTVIDECHTFFDLDGAKGSPAEEKLVRTCRQLAGQLVRKGRSVLAVTILITQKQTGDAIPTFIRDNCRHGLSFAVKTRDAAVAALGEGIHEYPSYCPTTLQSPEYVGVATAAIRTGHDP
ncbi:MAG: hypothetical protein JOZ77_13280, partial [Candidatus Eremiobacteraeota bacterium]|nr:hypothetical protein [Candidatus Eremiobacteraeota bacterium]